MIPKILSKMGVEIGPLPDLVEGYVIEERNGMCELEMVYPIFSENWTHLGRGNIVVASQNDVLKNQKFRIYNISKPFGGLIRVYARHISFDLARDIVEEIELTNASCEYALNELFRRSQFSQHFRGKSDIVNAQNFNLRNINLLAAIAGTQGSIIDIYGTGAEILRDNNIISILNKRGHNNGVSIEYAKNMTGLEIEVDDSNLITRIKAYAKYINEENEEVVIYSEPRYVDSQRINEYETPFIKEIDFSDKFKDKEIPNSSKLKGLADRYFEENKCDIVKTNIKVEFIPLSKCLGYEGIQDKISLCDTVRIIDSRYGLDTKAKVIKATYNVLTERYEKMELGEARTSLGDIIGGGNSGVEIGGDNTNKPPAIGDSNFPNTLPTTPVLTNTLYGFDRIGLAWTFEAKSYYTYELYASKEKDFTPNVFDLIHSGNTSSYLFQAKPNETWYFRVSAKNTHGKRTAFSNQVAVTTVKIDDLENYVSSAAIGDALIGELNLARGWVGQLNAQLLDVKGNFSVTDGNGKRTIDIDSFGNVTLLPTNFRILVNGKEEVVTTESTLAQLERDLTYYVDETKKVIDKEIEDVHLGMNNLEDTMNGAFKDGIIDEAEAKAINERLVRIELEKVDLDNEYTTIYNNIDLKNPEKSNLKVAYDDLIAKYSSLRTAIISAIADGIATNAEVRDINNKTEFYKVALGVLRTRVNEAINNIAINKSANALLEAKEYVNNEIKEVNESVSDIAQKADNINISVKSNTKLIDGLDKEKITLDQAKAEIDLKSNNILLQVQASGGGNIFVDSGFDLGNNKWSNFEYSWENRNFTISTWSDSSEWILQGTKAMCINVRGHEAAGELGFEQRIGVKKNQDYTLSVLMARHRADGGFHIYDVDSWDWITWDTILESEPYNAGKDIEAWKRMTVTFNSGNRSTIGIRFKMTKSSNDGHIWVTQPMLNEGRLRVPWSAKSLEANELVSYINLDSSSVKIKASKIELNGAVTAGDTSGNHIRIEEANYTVMNNGQQRALFGFKNMGNSYDKYVVPKLAMGAYGYESKHNYFVVIPYRGGDNPQNISNAYVDIGYHCISHDDWSNLKLYDGGDVRMAPIKNFEITTNYDKGSYAGTGERRLALFTTINHAYFNSHLQIGAIRNMTNGMGLVLADDTVSGAETRIRVNTDSGRQKFIRPCDNVGDIACGSSGFPWKLVATKTYYATDNLIYNKSKNIENEKIDIIDKIKFISPLDSKSAILMDISELVGTIYVPLEENVPAIDVTEFLKLALIEIQNLKEKFKKVGL